MKRIASNKAFAFIEDIMAYSDYILLYDEKEDSFYLQDAENESVNIIKNSKSSNILDVIKKLDKNILDAFYNDLADGIREEKGDIPLPVEFNKISNLAYELIQNNELNDMYEAPADILTFIYNIDKYKEILSNQNVIKNITVVIKKDVNKEKDEYELEEDELDLDI